MTEYKSPFNQEMDPEMSAELYNYRKWKALIIDDRDLMNVITGRIRITGIPDNCFLCRVGYRLERAGLTCILLNENFPPVPNAQEAPEIKYKLELIET